MSGKLQKVPLTKRFVAYIIDWFVGSLFISFPMVMYYLYRTNDVDNVSNVNIDMINNEFGISITIVVGIISLFLGAVYYFIIPLKNKGKTLGKAAFDFKIVKQNGSDVDFKTLFIRQIVVYLFLEVYLLSMGPLLLHLIELSANINLSFYFLITLIISIISCLMVTFGKNRLAIHDRITKTRVVSIKNTKKDNRI